MVCLKYSVMQILVKNSVEYKLKIQVLCRLYVPCSKSSMNPYKLVIPRASIDWTFFRFTMLEIMWQMPIITPPWQQWFFILVPRPRNEYKQRSIPYKSVDSPLKRFKESESVRTQWGVLRHWRMDYKTMATYISISVENVIIGVYFAIIYICINYDA